MEIRKLTPKKPKRSLKLSKGAIFFLIIFVVICYLIFYVIIPATTDSNKPSLLLFPFLFVPSLMIFSFIAFYTIKLIRKIKGGD